MRRTLAAAAVLIAALGMSAAPAVAQAAGYVPPPIRWSVCTDLELLIGGAECGTLVVPLNYAKPRGRKIKLAVARVRHRSGEAGYQGVMLTNPGGPGSPGRTLATLGAHVPGAVGGKYDWIGFDPRGVGASVPSLTCDDDYLSYNRPHYVPATAKLEKRWLARAARYAKACDRAGGALLDHVKTTDTVADMESLRKALGVRKISYYGFSYGTYLGQVYASLHPGRIHRMVLDGNVHPGRVWYRSNLDQDTPMDKNMTVFFAWVARHDKVYHLGKTYRVVRKKYYAQLRKLRTKPAGGRIGPAEWNDIFTGAAYYTATWANIADAFSAWVRNRDATELLWLYAESAGSDNHYAMYLAVECSDVKWPVRWSKWKRDNAALHARYPFFAWSNAWFNAPCRNWGAKPGKPVRVDGAKAPPILLIGETYDAATPFAGNLAVRKRFPRSVLIEGMGGTTHSGSLSGVPCTDNTIARYLDTGTLPPRQQGNGSDKKCPPVPRPNPLAAATTATTARDQLNDVIGIH